MPSSSSSVIISNCGSFPFVHVQAAFQAASASSDTPFKSSSQVSSQVLAPSLDDGSLLLTGEPFTFVWVEA
ncbi:MAG: hypothetical protein LUH63_19440 [Parabacteroides sp.]|nr:hypothetical protein [Parabacteroides sp.]